MARNKIALVGAGQVGGRDDLIGTNAKIIAEVGAAT
jgi:malate/lactate dehydrogenase